MTMEAAKNGAGVKIMDNLNDDRFIGMEKWEYTTDSTEGKKVSVHYVRDPKTGKTYDYKFK